MFIFPCRSNVFKRKCHCLFWEKRCRPLLRQGLVQMSLRQLVKTLYECILYYKSIQITDLLKVLYILVQIRVCHSNGSLWDLLGSKSFVVNEVTDCKGFSHLVDWLIGGKPEVVFPSWRSSSKGFSLRKQSCVFFVLNCDCFYSLPLLNCMIDISNFEFVLKSRWS